MWASCPPNGRHSALLAGKVVAGFAYVHLAVGQILIDDERLGRDRAIAADAAFAQYRRARAQRGVRPQLGVYVVVRADAATLVCDQIIGVTPAAEHRAERMHEQEDRRQLDLVI